MSEATEVEMEETVSEEPDYGVYTDMIQMLISLNMTPTEFIDSCMSGITDLKELKENHKILKCIHRQIIMMITYFKDEEIYVKEATSARDKALAETEKINSEIEQLQTLYDTLELDYNKLKEDPKNNVLIAGEKNELELAKASMKEQDPDIHRLRDQITAEKAIIQEGQQELEQVNLKIEELQQKSNTPSTSKRRRVT